MPRYEDDYGRREDPRASTVRREAREDRHGSSRGSERDRRILDDPRESLRSSRTQHPDPMDVVDPRMMSASARAPADPRGANAGARLEPRPEGRHGAAVSSRGMRDEPAYAYDHDHKQQRMPDPRAAEVYSREQIPRYSNPRDDRMDTDMDMPPQPTRRTATREVVGDYADDDHRSSRYNDYFVPGTGM